MGADEFRGRGSWIGTTNTSWTTASNWFDNYIPLATTHVEISGTAAFMPVISAATHPLETWLLKPVDVELLVELVLIRLQAKWETVVRSICLMALVD